MKTSGEGGELLLYLLLENVLELPQLMCKMPLKTSTSMHVHGVDGVHGKLLDNGDLALYWGESKLYARVNEAIDDCFASIAPYLLDFGGGDAQRDLLLTRTNLDLGDPETTAALVRYFDRTKPAASRVEFRGACLVGFDYGEYPNPFSEDGTTLQEEVVTQMSRWYDRIGARVADRQLTRIELEIFCVPLPSVQEFRDRLLAGLGS